MSAGKHVGFFCVTILVMIVVLFSFYGYMDMVRTEGNGVLATTMDGSLEPLQSVKRDFTGPAPFYRSVPILLVNSTGKVILTALLPYETVTVDTTFVSGRPPGQINFTGSAIVSSYIGTIKPENTQLSFQVTIVNQENRTVYWNVGIVFNGQSFRDQQALYASGVVLPPTILLLSLVLGYRKGLFGKHRLVEYVGLGAILVFLINQVWLLAQFSWGVSFFPLTDFWIVPTQIVVASPIATAVSEIPTFLVITLIVLSSLAVGSLSPRLVREVSSLIDSLISLIKPRTLADRVWFYAGFGTMYSIVLLNLLYYPAQVVLSSSPEIEQLSHPFSSLLNLTVSPNFANVAMLFSIGISFAAAQRIVFALVKPSEALQRRFLTGFVLLAFVLFLALVVGIYQDRTNRYAGLAWIGIASGNLVVLAFVAGLLDFTVDKLRNSLIPPSR